MTPEAFVNSMIGRHWSPRFNCWHLVAKASRDLFGREVPLSPLGRRRASHAERLALFDPSAHAGWQRASAPRHGAIVLMSRGAEPFGHAGIWLELSPVEAGCLHIDDPHGCVFDQMADLAARGLKPTFFEPK